MPYMPSASQVQATYQINGGAFAFQYTYDSSSTVAADPGAGKFRMNSNTGGFPTNVTHMYFGSVGGNGEDFGGWVNGTLGTLLANGMTPIIRFSSLTQPTKWADYYVTNYNVTTYTDLSVSFITANGYPPSGVSKDVVVSVIPSGGQAGPVWIFDGSTTTLSGVGPGFFRMNGNPLTSTKIGLNGTTRNMQDWSGLWPNVHQTSGPVKARVILFDLATMGQGATQNFAYYEINAFVTHPGDYEELQITYVDTTDTSGSTPFATFDPVLFCFQWVGVGAKLAPTAVKTGAYNAVANDLVKVDTTSAPVTVTLPTAPTDGTQIAVKCVTYASNVTIAAGGADVFNKTAGPTTLTLTAVNTGYQLQYQTTGAIWNVIGSISP